MKFQLKVLVVVLLTAAVKDVLCTNILHFATIASPSHYIWNRALAMGLAKKGYNVTILSHDVEKTQPPNTYHSIVIEGIYEILYDVFDMEQFAETNALNSMVDLYGYAEFMCEFDYNSTGLQKLLDYPKDFKFDLIIIDVTVGRCTYPLVHKFGNPPVIAVTPFLVPPVLANVFGGHQYTSYVPYYNTKFSNKMSFIERFLNFILIHAEILYRNYIFLPRENELIKKRFPDFDVSKVDEIERNISLILCNYDPAMEYPLPLPPNIIPVGGLHARPAQPLPKDLKDAADKAKEGVILFSLGSNVRSDQLPLETQQQLIKAFEKLPQVVFWKFESDGLKNIPKNVIISKWLPQNDVLGHPNTKLFISHGGGLSTQEAIYHGVPLVGIPFFADQHVNLLKLKEKGVAQVLDRKKLTTERVFSTIQEMINNPSYQNNMNTLSSVYRDQPQTALERGIFWVEFVLKHGHAEHLNLPARDMPAYQTGNLDVLFVFLVIAALLYSVIIFLLTLCKFAISLRKYDTKPKRTK